MDRATAIDLNRRLLHNFTTNSTDTAAAEDRVPSLAFSCPDRLARERESLFRQTPQVLAFSAELAAPGSYLALDVLDVPLLLTRDDQGVLHALVNSCSHRGAALASGAGQGGNLVCPFHGWSYSLDGRLRGRPGQQYFTSSAEDCALARLPVAEKYGLVVVGLTSALPASEVDGALDEPGDELQSFRLQQYQLIERRNFEVRANWKLVNDLSLESYHFNTVHRDSVAQLLAPHAVTDSYRSYTRWAFPLQSIGRLAELDESQWPDTVEGSCTYTLYPGVMLIVNATGAQMIRAEPGDSPGETRVSYVGLCRDNCDMDSAREAYNFGGEVFEREDLPVAEQCQRGMAAGQRDLLLGRNEPLLQFWHRLWQQAID